MGKDNPVYEYDNYVIPPYDPTISDEERERLIKEAEKNYEETMRRIFGAKG